jgi:two-component system, OmpR family, phosphate regulon response regulator OmpR
MTRRQRILGAHHGPAPAEARIAFGRFVLDIGQRRLLRDGEDLPMTTAEFALLQAFASHPQRPLGRDRLIELARGRDHEASDRSIDVQVMRLRKLIEADPSEPRFIRTVWGVGYVFVPDGA